MQSETELQVEQELARITHYCRQLAVANTSAQRLIDDQKAIIDKQRAELAGHMNDYAILKVVYENMVKQRDAAVADNAALIAVMKDSWYRLAGIDGDQVRNVRWKLNKAINDDHPGTAIIADLEKARDERDYYRDLLET